MATLVFDASPLSYFARAGLLDELERLTVGSKRCVTHTVVAEIRNGKHAHPALGAVIAAPWLDVVSVDTLEGLQLFATYARRLGSARSNAGEAETLAWAELHAAIAVVDERAARKIAESRGVRLRGSIGIICNAVAERSISVDAGRAHLVGLRDAGAWLPWSTGEYDAWAASMGLL